MLSIRPLSLLATLLLPVLLLAQEPPAVAPEPAAAESVPNVPAPPTPPESTPAPSDFSEPPDDLLPPPGAVPPRTPTESVVTNLLNLLVERKVLTAGDASGLIRQAEDEAETAKQQAAEVERASETAALAAAAAVREADPDPSDVRVTYIPETVRNQIREEIKLEVMTQARDENWADPRLLPDWVKDITLFGDVRVRQENVFFEEGNDNTGSFPNFNAINSGSPFDVSGVVFSPQLNVDENRQRQRLRVRLGLRADLGEGFTAGLRIATGENNSPVSTNQSLGSDGGFSKYSIWLDRGFVKYEFGSEPDRSFALSMGRFDNPFFSTEVIFDDDLGFDGIALSARYRLWKSVTPFLTAGAFPIFNTSFNFASNQPNKFESDDKYLYAIQGGIDVKPTRHISFRGSVALYRFDNVQGQLSDPFVPLSASDAGNTDSTRPLFAQKGNTYRPLRNITPVAANNFGTTMQFQYFGLASEFTPLALTGKLDLNYWEPVQISIFGEYIRNLDFNGDFIDGVAVNNRGPIGAGDVGPFDGGDTAWIVGLRIGSAVLAKRFDWNFGFTYRHVETDAVVDGFADSDFGLGGTNVEGYTAFANLALSPRVALGARWLSSTEITGPPLRVDILQIDLNAKF